MTNDLIESVCIFGSSARGSADCLSDRDVLVVADDPERRAQISAEWKGMNWSVAVYTPTRFKRMVEARSLFVQHLKLEGLIVKDKHGWLGACLRGARPKNSYADDAANSVLLARPLERFDADALIGKNLVTSDLGYVAVRNFGICHLADIGRLSFDYSKIISCLTDDFDLDSGEVRMLKSLREGKVAYRNGVDCLQLEGSVGRLRTVLSTFFSDRPLCQIDLDHPVRWLGGGYTMLRDFEALIVSRLGQCPKFSELEENGLQEVWKWISSPRTYSWSVRNAPRIELERIGRTITSRLRTGLGKMYRISQLHAETGSVHS